MSPSPAQLSPNPNSTIRRSTSKPLPQDPSSPIANIGENRQKDFSFLLRPEIYHPLTPLNVPQAFRTSAKQPNPNSSPEELLAKGHFRAAAIAAVQELTGSSAVGGLDPRNSKRIFDLLYVRLACLTLIEATPLAAQEVKALEDLNSVRTYVDEVTGEHLVPWELRVLNVRLQALGFGDPRRAVMSYHDLAKEARQQVTKAAGKHDNSATELWKVRLHDLGIKVASALIGMDDLSGAAHHLKTLRSRGDGKLELSKALLWLHLGSADDARECAERCTDNKMTEEIIQALCDMAEAEYELALSRWRDLLDSSGKSDEMISVNAAVCLLYLGRIQEVSKLEETTIVATLTRQHRDGIYWNNWSTRDSRLTRFCLTCAQCTNCAQRRIRFSRSS